MRKPNNPQETAQFARLEAGDFAAFKHELLASVQLYADITAGRTCMGSPVLAENVLAGIEWQIDALARGVVPSAPSSEQRAKAWELLTEDYEATVMALDRGDFDWQKERKFILHRLATALKMWRGVDSGGVAPAGEPSAEQNDATRPASSGNALFNDVVGGSSCSGEALPKP